MSVEFAGLDAHVDAIRQQICATENSLRNLKLQLQEAEQHAEAAKQLHKSDNSDTTLPSVQHHARVQDQSHETSQPPSDGAKFHDSTETTYRWPLSPDEYKRYGRQLIMPEIGLHGQLQLHQAKVCIVGVGGLGCPAAAYLAGAGVKTLGLVDGDTVEASNLHRQIAHSTDRVGWTKVQSACSYLKQLNPHVEYVQHASHLTPKSAIDVFSAYDIVLDCTDHPTSRYLISDACVLTGKPLVSASALKTEGQLIVLNNPPKAPGDPSGGPCYRCIFPKPPPPETLQSCGEGGIMGPVVGVMGILQALEAIKILTDRTQTTNLASESNPPSKNDQPVKPTLLMFSAYGSPQFRSVRMRSRRAECAMCSSEATISAESLTSGSLDYIAFCGVTSAVQILPDHLRIKAKDFVKILSDENSKLIDVRDATQYQIAALKGSVNVPWTGSASSWLQNIDETGVFNGDSSDYYIVCRLGNDSQMAAKALLDRSPEQKSVKDISGGFQAWKKEVDPTWPDF